MIIFMVVYVLFFEDLFFRISKFSGNKCVTHLPWELALGRKKVWTPPPPGVGTHYITKLLGGPNFAYLDLCPILIHGDPLPPV